MKNEKDPFLWAKPITNIIIMFITWGLWQSGEINLIAFIIIVIMFLVNVKEIWTL